MAKLFQNLEKFKNRIALISSNDKKYSYKEITKKSKYISSKIENGSVILIVASNNIESIIGYISFIRSKNLSILLDKNFKLDYIKKIIKKYKPNYIFCPKEFAHIVKKNCQIISFQDYNLIKTDYKKHKKINKKNLLLLSTSGTTQNPKFVRLSNLNLESNTTSITKYLNINSNHTTITTMPMAYSYGLSIINTHLSSGSRIVVNNKTIFDKDFWKKIKMYKITSFGGVPDFYEYLKRIKFDKFELPSLKYFTQAGGKLNDNTLKYFGNICRKKFIKFIVMYGQTEASPRMSYLEWDKFFLKFGSIGKSLSKSRFKILGKAGKYINKAFSIGELIFLGKNVSLGYANSFHDLKKGDENKGKLFTGDLGYKDKENYYYLTGRKNRYSKIFGIRINLDDIQKQLKKDSYTIKCISDNKYLKIQIIYNYDIEKIKEIIHNHYGINKNFITISKVKRFSNHSNFKKTMNLN